MKREENKKQQNTQTEQKEQLILRVRSGLRAGATSNLNGCIDI